MEPNLSRYELAESAVLTLKDPGGETAEVGDDNEPITVEIYSPGSKPGRAALLKEKRASDARTWKGLRKELAGNDVDQQAEERIEKLIAVTKSISPNLKATVREVFSDSLLCHWHDQVEEFFARKANFKKGSSQA